jgi:hypothetical protein
MKRLRLFAVIAVILMSSLGTGRTHDPVVVNGVIAALGDDDQLYNDGTWKIAGTDSMGIWFGSNASLPDIAWCRFTLAAAIPAGATISTTAGDTAITFTSNGDHVVDEAYLYVTESADAAQVTAAAQRPAWAGTGSTTTYPTTIRGTGSVHWTGTWPASGTVVIDVGPLIQYLVTTYSGLANGTHVAFWMDGPAGTSAESGFLSYESGGGSSKEKLKITYTTGSPPSWTNMPAALHAIIWLTRIPVIQ